MHILMIFYQNFNVALPVVHDRENKNNSRGVSRGVFAAVFTHLSHELLTVSNTTCLRF